MKLILRVVSYEGHAIEGPKNLVLNKQSASIGRNPENTLILPDAKKYVGRQHALIEYRPPHYYLKDVSTNGVFVNHSGTPVGKGNCAELKYGDLIGIGDYLLEVRFEDDQDDGGPRITGAYFPSDLHLPDAGGDRLVPASIDDIIEKEALFSSTGEPIRQPSRSPSDADTPCGQNRREYGPVAPHRRPLPASPSNRQASLDQERAAGRAPENAAASVILPADWDSLNRIHQDLVDDLVKDVVEDPAPPADPEPAAAAASPADADNPDRLPKSAAERAYAGFDPLDDTAKKIIKNFLDGIQLDAGKFQDLITPETFFTVGVILRVAIQGTKNVLLSRAIIKDEADVTPTYMAATHNNPYKFSVSANEIIQKLLFHEEFIGYMPPKEATEEVFEDIQGHEISVIAGMKAALRAVFNRFDPDLQKARLKKLSPSSHKIPILGKAKLWNLIEQLYCDMEQELDDNVDKLYGRSFSEAYETAMRSFKKSKKNH